MGIHQSHTLMPYWITSIVAIIRVRNHESRWGGWAYEQLAVNVAFLHERNFTFSSGLYQHKSNLIANQHLNCSSPVCNPNRRHVNSRLNSICSTCAPVNADHLSYAFCLLGKYQSFVDIQRSWDLDIQPNYNFDM